MPKEIFEGLQNLHFDTLTLSLTCVNWVKGFVKGARKFIRRPHNVDIIH
jgi:hypothetical protein